MRRREDDRFLKLSGMMKMRMLSFTSFMEYGAAGYAVPRMSTPFILLTHNDQAQGILNVKIVKKIHQLLCFIVHSQYVDQVCTV